MDTLIEIAVLDDYQNVAMLYADWSVIQQQAKVTIFNDHRVFYGDTVHAIEEWLAS
jgi:hypothetical protein